MRRIRDWIIESHPIYNGNTLQDNTLKPPSMSQRNLPNILPHLNKETYEIQYITPHSRNTSHANLSNVNTSNGISAPPHSYCIDPCLQPCRDVPSYSCPSLASINPFAYSKKKDQDLAWINLYCTHLLKMEVPRSIPSYSICICTYPTESEMRTPSRAEIP
jgi:hypothetical protein